jgi:hypothetical protein
MRSVSWTRWASCALALSLVTPALADKLADKPADNPRPHKTLDDCTSFEQADKGADQVEMTLTNRCTLPVSCSISWRVVCAPQSRKRRSVHPTTSKLALVEGATQSTTASASQCGDDGWSIDHIDWSCKPDEE